MKKALAILSLTLLALNAFAQDTISTAEIKARKQASLRLMAPHGLLTMFIGEDINDATVLLQQFMEDKLSMTISDKPGTYTVTKQKGGITKLHIVFSDKISYSTPKKIILDITATDQPTGGIIKTCEFSGDTKSLISFFVEYWNTTVQINDSKSSLIAVRNMPGEKASLLSNAGVAKIKIEKL